jgi:DNA replication initiation complex subunit (GINS family)
MLKLFSDNPYILKRFIKIVRIHVVRGVRQLMADINITYDLLFDILRYEKSREELQQLDTEFYLHVIEYLKTKEDILLNSQTPVVERELTRIQLNNVRKILSELYEKRERKIINLALYTIKTGSGITADSLMLTGEKMLFEMLLMVISRYRSSILDNLLNGRSVVAESLISARPQIADSDLLQSRASVDSGVSNEIYSDIHDAVKSVRFLRPIPRFLGPELEIYGPFEEDDIASLPLIISNMLIRTSRAVGMDVAH